MKRFLGMIAILTIGGCVSPGDDAGISRQTPARQPDERRVEPPRQRIEKARCRTHWIGDRTLTECSEGS